MIIEPICRIILLLLKLINNKTPSDALKALPKTKLFIVCYTVGRID